MWQKLRELILSPSRFKRDVLWNVGSLAVLAVSGLAANLLIMYWRGPDALGVFNEVFAIYIVVSQLAVGGAQISALKHCAHAQDDLPRCGAIASSALMLVGAASLAMALGLHASRGAIGAALDSPAVARGVGFVCPGLVFFSLNKVLANVLIGLRNMRAYAVFQASRYVLIVAGVVVLLGLGLPAPHLALSLTLAEAVLFVLMAAYVQARLFPLKFSLSRETRAWLRRHFSFGIRSLLSGVMSEMNTRVDVLLLGYFLSDALVGVYSFASIFAEGFAQLTIVVRFNVEPIIGKMFSQGEQAGIHALAQRIRAAFYPVMILLGTVAVLAFPVLICLQRSATRAWGSWGVFAILVAGAVGGCGYRPFLGVLVQGGRPGVYSLVMIGSVLVNALLNVCLIPLWGIYGSALATGSVSILEACAIVILAGKLFAVRL